MATPGSAVISFGLVAIPVRIIPAIQSRKITFHWLHKKCGSRVQNRYYCPVENVVVEREDLVRGFKIAKGKYVRITEEELERLEAEANKNIELKEFIPIASVDPVYYEGVYYLGADKGGEKPYRLLTDALRTSARGGIAQMVSRGKEELVMIRPYRNGLVLHTLYYHDEVRDFGQIPKGENVDVGKDELELAITLIDRLSAERFEPEKYKDVYRERLEAMLAAKARGQEIAIPAAPPPPRPGRVIDLMDALKRSMADAARSEARAGRARSTATKKALKAS
jgi:DNA end-binding protein Ku